MEIVLNTLTVPENIADESSRDCSIVGSDKTSQAYVSLAKAVGIIIIDAMRIMRRGEVDKQAVSSSPLLLLNFYPNASRLSLFLSDFDGCSNSSMKYHD